MTIANCLTRWLRDGERRAGAGLPRAFAQGSKAGPWPSKSGRAPSPWRARARGI